MLKHLHYYYHKYSVSISFDKNYPIAFAIQIALNIIIGIYYMYINASCFDREKDSHSYIRVISKLELELYQINGINKTYI